MLVWLDTFEVLAPRLQDSSATLTEFAAATQNPVTAGKVPGFTAEESGATSPPKRRRGSRARDTRDTRRER